MIGVVTTAEQWALRKPSPVLGARPGFVSLHNIVNLFKQRWLVVGLASSLWAPVILAGVKITDEVATPQPATPASSAALEPLPAGTPSYPELLQAGDEYRARKQFDLALKAYSTAIRRANNNTEQGLALGKTGMVYVYDKHDYTAARVAAYAALQLDGAGSISQVTALEVLAECQMKVDQDNVAAAQNIERALQLDGVAWSKPHLTLKLGDCYRASNRYDDALAMYQKVATMPAANSSVKASSYLNMGLTYQYDLHDGGKARAAYAVATQLRPDLRTEIAGHLTELR